MALSEEKRERIRQRALDRFRKSLVDLLNYPPSTWTVVGSGGSWFIVTPDGGQLGHFGRKRDALAAINDPDSYDQRQYRERIAWTLGESRDPRNRPLTDDERAIVAEVLATREAQSVG